MLLVLVKVSVCGSQKLLPSDGTLELRSHPEGPACQELRKDNIFFFPPDEVIHQNSHTKCVHVRSLRTAKIGIYTSFCVPLAPLNTSV